MAPCPSLSTHLEPGLGAVDPLDDLLQHLLQGPASAPAGRRPLARRRRAGLLLCLTQLLRLRMLPALQLWQSGAGAEGLSASGAQGWRCRAHCTRLRLEPRLWLLLLL